MNRFLDLNNVASQDGIFQPLYRPAPDELPMLTMSPGRAEKKSIESRLSVFQSCSSLSNFPSIF